MDIKDGFATSSKEHLQSLVRVHELDGITSNGGKDRRATKEHPRGLKRKKTELHVRRTSVLDERMTTSKSCKWRGKVHNHLSTHGSEGATEPGRIGPGPVGSGRPAQPSSGVGSAPLSLHPKDRQP
jgi:hypothetical protein